MTDPIVQFSNWNRPSQYVSAYLAMEKPLLQEGSSGWQEEARPGLDSLVWWDSREQDKLVLSCMFDWWTQDRDCGPWITAMRGLKLPGAGMRHPPIVRIRGPIPYPGVTTSKWIIDTLEWGNYERSVRKNFITRQFFTVTLKRYQPGTTVVARGQDATAYRTVTVTKALPNLHRIASKYLGDWRRWVEITDTKGKKFRTWNRIKIGTKVRVPPS